MQKIVKMWLLTVMVMIGSGVESKACEVPTYESVAQLYVATFNRAPDSVGINYWLNESFGGHACLEGIASSFFDQPETKALYSEGSSPEDFIRSVYHNLFNRESEFEGLTYWSHELEIGNIKKSEFILAVINGAQDTEEYGQDKTILQNKKEVGLAFANADLNDVEQAKEIMQNVTGIEISVENALAMINIFKNGSGTGGVDFEAFNTCQVITDYDNDTYAIHLHYTMDVGVTGGIKSVKESNPYVAIDICKLILADEPFTVNKFYKTMRMDMVVDGEIIKGTVAYDSVARTIKYNGFISEQGDFSCTEKYNEVPFPMLIEDDDMVNELLGTWEHAAGRDDENLAETSCPDYFYDMDTGDESDVSDTNVQGTSEIKIVLIDDQGNESKIYTKITSGTP